MAVGTRAAPILVAAKLGPQGYANGRPSDFWQWAMAVFIICLRIATHTNNPYLRRGIMNGTAELYCRVRILFQTDHRSLHINR